MAEISMFINGAQIVCVSIVSLLLPQLSSQVFQQTMGLPTWRWSTPPTQTLKLMVDDFEDSASIFTVYGASSLDPFAVICDVTSLAACKVAMVFPSLYPTLTCVAQVLTAFQYYLV